ncbi:tenascin-like [Calonectris borealis]|uniref:tenascin-like n=1 Tax=Calonectris borealis TaxID=1323832 RepID=UPI003F4C0D05
MPARPAAGGDIRLGAGLASLGSGAAPPQGAGSLGGSESLDCDHVKKPAGVVLMEWTELPKGEDPDYYIVTYQRADAFSQKNVRNISKVEQKLVSTTILLEENKKYDITIESLKNGRIISVKSFKTRTCSQGWVAFQSSCYRMGKESKSWKVAQQICETSSRGAHLLDIGSKEEHGFILSYLQTISQIIMLWTGLNDLKEEGQLLWTDGSPYLLKAGISTLSMIPEDETDCYALQRDPTGPDYFFTGFFCYIQLPYICEYELPLVPENFTFSVRDVKTTEAVFMWSEMDIWLKSGFALIIKYYFDQLKPYILSLPVNTTQTKIVQLSPGLRYSFLLAARNLEGAQTNLSPILKIETTVSPPTAVYIHPEDVQEESVILHWKLPQEGQESYIQVKPNADIGETKKFLISNTEEFKIDLLIPGMAYEIAVATVNNGNMSELKTIQCTLKPKPVQIVVPCVLYSNAVVLFVRMPDIGVFDGIYVTSKGGPNVTFILKSDGKITIGNLTAGTEYDFCVSTKSGLAAPLNVREGNVTDTSIQIAWDRADGDFQQYEVICTNCASAFRVQKVKQETATFSSLTPGKLYNFTIRTEKEGFRDSIFVTKEIETVPSAVKYLNYSRDSESITVTWPPAQNMFDGYVISINSKVFNEEKMLPSGVRMYKFESLLPGTDYLIGIVTTNGLKRSHPTILKISTCKFTVY